MHALKSFILLAFTVILSTTCFAQEKLNEQIISSLPDSVRLLALGDPTHQESTITTHRIQLIKKFVREKDFKVIAIEGNLFELYEAHQKFLEDKKYSHYERAMYSMLNATEMEELYDFVYEENKRGNPIYIVGFDAVPSGMTLAEKATKYIQQITWLSDFEKEDFVIQLKKASDTSLKTLFRNRKEIKTKIVAYSHKVLSKFTPQTQDEFVFEQTLKNLLFLHQDDASNTQNWDNRRDMGMFNTIKFIQGQFNNPKIILFGSSTHLLKQPKAIHSPFFQNGRVTLGEQLTQYYKNQYFFIAYTALSGRKSNWKNNAVELPILTESSIEHKIKTQTDSSICYIMPNTVQVVTPIFCRFMGHSFVELDLWKTLDGLVLIEDCEPFKIKTLEE